MRRRTRRAAAVLTLLTALGTTAACQSSDGEPGDPSASAEPSDTTSAPPSPTAAPTGDPQLTFGVFGAEDEVEAYRSVVTSFETVQPDTQVRLRAWGSRREAVRALRTGDLPDVFMVNRRDLGWFLERERTQPVDELLDERGVNFGDDYSRAALNSFAADNALQCMPWTISPMVMYYNTELVDFDRMRELDLDAPDSTDRWTLEEFAAAADFAAKPRRDIRGVHVEPTLSGLAPFIYSGGGTLFDDDTAPTSLAFSSEETQAALERTLEVLRNAQLTPSEQELEERTALEMFEAGDLGMIAGYRSLTPHLREAGSVPFDVMPMPVLDSGATVADVTGLCLAADSDFPAAAADFLVHALAETTVRQVARAGYLVPANVAVGNSGDFLQPGRAPDNASVFITQARAVVELPTLEGWARLEATVHDDLEDLLTVPVLDLPTATADIDAESRPILAEESDEASPTD